MNAYTTEGWSDFAVATVGASAALAGLVFVAVSLNLRVILADAHLPGRAAQTLVLLATPLFVGLPVLVPGQADAALAIELVVVGVLAGGALVRQALPGRRAPEQPVAAWLLTAWVPALAVLVAPVLAGTGVLTGTAGGLYWMPVAVVLALLGGLVNAWALLVEILR
ncbi:hypothetical protein GCM10023201_53420 [Actinomycetospora corticicola]|uniref:Modulator of FtsH protease n=1 Tax=Actinomycetospora corticicola TaxID=663602 RepID=A0A7Y9J3U0_9PSEU|nr:hypothetical protein [Actinomycetospora corticicola]NYD34418.1 modulator of FtsH protease [Actinomycetospora corticicola]